MDRVKQVIVAVLAITSASTTLATTRICDAQSVQVVRSTQPPIWGSSLQLVRRMHIGEVDGDERYLFGRVRNVAVLKSGTVVVADDKTPVLRMYDSRGKFLRDIGRAGEGPGEYRSMGGVGATPDGRIILWDNRIQRLTYYSPSGETIKSVRVPSGLFSADLFHVDGDGTSYVRCVLGQPRNLEDWAFGWIHVSPNGVILDTIPVPELANRPNAFVLSTASGYDRPFNRDLVSTMSSRGALLVGDNSSYAFEQRRRGAPTVRIERAYSPIPVVGAERREWEEWATYMENLQRRQFTGNKVLQPTPVRAKSYSIPTVKPAYSELLSDADGRIWVRRYVAAVSRPGDKRKAGDLRPRRVWREQPTFDVFEADGRFLGVVTLPWDARFEDAMGMSIWATVTGELGEETIVRYEIARI